MEFFFTKLFSDIVPGTSKKKLAVLNLSKQKKHLYITFVLWYSP